MFRETKREFSLLQGYELVVRLLVLLDRLSKVLLSQRPLAIRRGVYEHVLQVVNSLIFSSYSRSVSFSGKLVRNVAMELQI